MPRLANSTPVASDEAEVTNAAARNRGNKKNRSGGKSRNGESRSNASERRGPGRPRKDETRTAERGARNSRDANRSGKDRAARSGKTGGNKNRSGEPRRKELNISVTMEAAKETKNKIQFVELDDAGDPVENPFRDGVIGSLYLPKEEVGNRKRIVVRVTAE